jgi:hypothetical protein
MEGVGSERVTRNPCIHAATKFPAVPNNAACGWLKSIEKLRISTVFLGFWGANADFCRFYAGFAHFGLENPRQNCAIPLTGVPSALREPLALEACPCSHLSPNSTIFFGFIAAAIGVFSASTTGAAILK